MIEPDVADALRRMGAVLAAAPAFTVRMTARREGRLPIDQVVLLGATSEVLAHGPDRLAARVGSDLGSFSLVGLGANLPEDAVYPLTRGLADGRPFRGEHG